MMTKEQVYNLMCIIQEYYENFSIHQQKIDSWYKILKKYDENYLKKNLLRHIENEKFPPTVSDLVKKPEKQKAERIIPSMVVTKEYLNEMDSLKNNRSNEKVIHQHLSDIRNILGIGRETT
jgi:Loader and inhibitor of phage G40P